jgi:thymidylate synthase
VSGYVFTIDNMRHDYIQLLDKVMAHGASVAPRGFPTRELFGVTVVHEQPANCLATGINRGINTRLVALECLQLIAGVSDPALMVSVAPNTKQFLDGGQFHGAYGPRLQPQLACCIDKLREDRDTRQAVALIWDPLRDLMSPVTPHDVPCTIELQFFIRGGKLLMHTTMRSEDVWWGVAYDIPQFTQLQATVAHCLDLDVGRYVHHVKSFHVYERDFDAIEALSIEPNHLPLWIEGIGAVGESWGEAATRARKLMYGESVGNTLWYSEAWFASKAKTWQ